MCKALSLSLSPLCGLLTGNWVLYTDGGTQHNVPEGDSL
jgi:hypothetical protein